jgi:hypothetical protein
MARLTRDQADAFARTLHPKVGYIVGARERMERLALNTDPVYQLVRKAEDAIRALWVELHYRSCESGVARPSDGGQEPPA